MGQFGENAVSRLAEVPGVDAISFGHAHAEFPSPAFASHPKVDIAQGTINGVAAVMPGRWGDHLGVVDLTLDNSGGTWKVKDSKVALVADDPSVQIVSNAQTAYVQRAMQGTEYEKFPVLSAAAPFKSGGRQGWSYYTDIPAGPLAIKHTADLYICLSTFKAMLLTGAEVGEWLEMSAGQFNQIDPRGAPQQILISSAFPSFNFDTMDGSVTRWT